MKFYGARITLLSLLFVPIVCTVSADVPVNCMRCIWFAESSCQETVTPSCHLDGTSDSCGPFQIKEDYFVDANQKAGGSLGGGSYF